MFRLPYLCVGGTTLGSGCLRGGGTSGRMRIEGDYLHAADWRVGRTTAGDVEIARINTRLDPGGVR